MTALASRKRCGGASARELVGGGLVLLLAGCGVVAEAPSPGGTLRAAVVGQYSPEAGPYALAGPQAMVTDATQQGLVELDGTGAVVPALALSWGVSDDGLSYVFRLRETQWIDGRPIEAGDVVAVLRRVLAPGSEHPLKPHLMAVENAPAVARGELPVEELGVDDPVPGVVEIRLAAPHPALLQVLAHPSLSIVRKGANPPASGPFLLPDPTEPTLRLLSNPGFYDVENVALAEVRLTPLANPEEAIAHFRRGEADLVTGGATAGLARARAVPLSGALRIEPSHGAYGYIANTQKGPLADARVRRALAMAIEREALLARLFNVPQMLPLNGLVPPNLPDHGGAVEPEWAGLTFEERLAEAAALLEQAGYGPGRPLRIEVSLAQGSEHAEVLRAVAAGWARLGVRVTGTQRPLAEHEARVAAGNFQLALAERFAPATVPSYFLDPFRCGAGPSGYCSREVDALLAGAAMAPMDAAPLRRAERALLADAPAIMLFTPVRWSLVRPGVQGWTSNLLGSHPLSRLDVVSG